MENYELAWTLMCELRKEIIEAQKNRTEIIKIKFLFVSTLCSLIGITFINSSTFESIVLIIPALSSISFDFMIIGYNFSINRIGVYCREILEEHLQQEFDFIFWENYLTNKSEDFIDNQLIFSFGNFLFTAIIAIVSITCLLYFPDALLPIVRYTVLFFLALFLLMDLYLLFFAKAREKISFDFFKHFFSARSNID